MFKNELDVIYNINTDKLHAEEALLNHIESNNIKLNKIDIIVIRTNKQNKLRNSKPCLKCINKMKLFQSNNNIINNIIYSIDDNILFKSYVELINDVYQHIPVSMTEWNINQ